MDKRCCLGPRLTLSLCSLLLLPTYDAIGGGGGGRMLRFDDEDLRCSRNERKDNLFILHFVRGRIREKARRGVWRGDFVWNGEKD